MGLLSWFLLISCSLGCKVLRIFLVLWYCISGWLLVVLSGLYDSGLFTAEGIS
jgi:hypothetical protein